MRFYNEQRQFYCGIDLHASTMYVWILDREGNTVLHRNIRTRPGTLLRTIQPYREGLVIGCECMFTWYWLADLCKREGIEFILGHALYLRAIHGGKSKNDRIDAEKLARLMRGGTFPLSYVYPAEMRSTRDLLRRRMHLMRRRSELLAHIHMTYQQYNVDCPNRRLRYAGNRDGLGDPFDDASVKKMMAVDVAVIDRLDELLNDLELYLVRHAKVHDGQTFHRLRSVPGIGKVLALVLMYEIHDIGRFPGVGNFISYCRLVKCSHSSAGKVCGSGGRKMGNAFLRWAFGEAACLFIRQVPEAKRWIDRKEKKYGKSKALALLSAKLGRAVYWMLKREEVFDVEKFFQS
jgi:transposase